MGFTNEDARLNQLKTVAKAYFAALSRRDVSSVPWAEDVVLRSPLAPQGLDVPVTGRDAVVAWFETLYPVLGETKVIEHYFSQDLTTVDAAGRITHQENHYDPRPALASTA